LSALGLKELKIVIELQFLKYRYPLGWGKSNPQMTYKLGSNEQEIFSFLQNQRVLLI
jgi:hypothetical protein